MNKWLPLICLIYLVSPIDFLPEAMLGPLGLPDDLIAIVVGIRSAFGNIGKK